MRTSVAAFAAVFMILSDTTFAQSVKFKPLKGHSTRLDAVPGEILVQLAPQATSKGMAATTLAQSLVSQLGLGVVRDLVPLSFKSGLFKVKVDPAKFVGTSLQSVISKLRGVTGVEIAEPNYLYYAFEDSSPTAGLPNDAEFAKLWGLNNEGQIDLAGQQGKAGSDIHVLPLWSQGITGSKDITVAVIDTGVSWNHPDLIENLYTNAAESGEPNQIDEDGNGYVDDIHGWNFITNAPNSADDHNHGTHCAGTIGAQGNNDQGVAGVNWNVRIMPLKFLTAQGGGSLEDAVEAIQYATKMKVNVMSNSWGGGGPSDLLKQAIIASKDAGIAFIAAAGNDNSDNDQRPTYPGSYDVENIIAVAATDNQDKMATFSNYGARTVHVAAPGVKIYSTYKNGLYGVMSGTSMATPHVAGIAALLLSVHPEWSYAELKDRLIKTSDPVASLRKRVVAKGRVNAFNALTGTIPPSQEPDESRWENMDYSIESPHPYADYLNQAFEVTVPGAKYIRVIFEKIDVEKNYDKVRIESAQGEVFDQYTGTALNLVSEYVPGEKLIIRLKTDESTNGYGFKVSQIQVQR